MNDVKIFLTCLILSFILGAFFVELIEAHRALDKGCVIKFVHGKETNIHIGHTSDD
jgi:hypothetical protein